MTSRHNSEQRVVLVTNPNSSSNAHVQREVVDQLDSQSVAYHHITTKYPEAEANIEDLASSLRDGDRVIGAVGDGTAGQLANAALMSETDLQLGLLPYGNANDIAVTHTKKSSVLDLLTADSVDVIPIDVSLDDEHWRYAVAYFSIGWTAVAVAEFDSESSRRNLQRLPRQLKIGWSAVQVVKNYIRHRHEYLPPFHTSESPRIHNKTTDIVAINSPHVAHVIRTADSYHDKDYFGYKEADNSNILPNIPFLLQAFAGRAPLQPLTRLDIEFEEGVAEVTVQTEGEPAVISAQKITVEKDPSVILRILHP